MKFQCQNPECKRLFHYADKLITTTPQFSTTPTVDPNYSATVQVQSNYWATTRESFVCPYYASKDFVEYVEPLPVQEVVSNVFIYDLTSGAQTDLDALLAQGYRIVSRYAKAYFLEKPQEKPAEAV